MKVLKYILLTIFTLIIIWILYMMSGTLWMKYKIGGLNNIKKIIISNSSKTIIYNITEQEKIDKIIKCFRLANDFEAGYTNCGFYIKIELIDESGDPVIFKAGSDDCNRFTSDKFPIKTANASFGTDYILKKYVIEIYKKSIERMKAGKIQKKM